MVMSAPPQFALSLPVPSLPSITASVSIFAPVRVAVSIFGASPPLSRPESATFLPSTHTPKYTLPRPAANRAVDADHRSKPDGFTLEVNREIPIGDERHGMRIRHAAKRIDRRGRRRGRRRTRAVAAAAARHAENWLHRREIEGIDPDAVSGAGPAAAGSRCPCGVSCALPPATTVTANAAAHRPNKTVVLNLMGCSCEEPIVPGPPDPEYRRQDIPRAVVQNPKRIPSSIFLGLSTFVGCAKKGDESTPL
jgi:hypothetical protein